MNLKFKMRVVAGAILMMCSTAGMAVRSSAAPVSYRTAYIQPFGAEGSQKWIEPNKDYFSLYLDDVFVNREESFFRRNNIAVTTKLRYGNSEITVPVYAERQGRVSGRLGLSHFPLMNFIPCNHTQLTMSVSVVRRDDNDPLKKTIDFLNTSGNNSVLKTFAASAIPYLGLIGGVANSLYENIGPPKSGDILFSANESFAVSPTASLDPSTLRDTVVLLYLSEGVLDSSKLTVDADRNVLFQGQPLTGMPWVAFRLQRVPTRSDTVGRTWERKFVEAIQTLRSPSVESAADITAAIKTANKLQGEAMTLLNEDNDFTRRDRDLRTSEWRAAIDAAKAALNSGPGGLNALSAAVESATQPAYLPTSDLTPANRSVAVVAPEAALLSVPRSAAIPRGMKRGSGYRYRAITYPKFGRVESTKTTINPVILRAKLRAQ